MAGVCRCEPLVTDSETALNQLSDTAEALAMNDYVTVETTSGKVKGSARAGVNIFKGILYGGPVSGERRFSPAEKPAP